MTEDLFAREIGRILQASAEEEASRIASPLHGWFRPGIYINPLTVGDFIEALNKAIPPQTRVPTTQDDPTAAPTFLGSDIIEHNVIPHLQIWFVTREKITVFRLPEDMA